MYDLFTSLSKEYNILLGLRPQTSFNVTWKQFIKSAQQIIFVSPGLEVKPSSLEMLTSASSFSFESFSWLAFNSSSSLASAESGGSFWLSLFSVWGAVRLSCAFVGVAEAPVVQ